MAPNKVDAFGRESRCTEAHVLAYLSCPGRTRAVGGNWHGRAGHDSEGLVEPWGQLWP